MSNKATKAGKGFEVTTGKPKSPEQPVNEQVLNSGPGAPQAPNPANSFNPQGQQKLILQAIMRALASQGRI